MIKTPLSTVIGGAFWTPGAVQIGSSSKNLSQLIKSLFSLGEQGFAYDPNDLSTLYQDAAGTIPVTAAGQPVGLMKDKSGRNNHAYQTVSASRPILQRNATTGAYYLAFDGVDDFLQTNNIDFTATDKVSLFAGARKLSDAAIGVIAELSTNVNSNLGSFYLAAPPTASTASVAFASRGIDTKIVYKGSLASPISFVATGSADIAADISYLRINGIESSKNSSEAGGGNFGNYPLYIGRRGGTLLPFTGHLYSLIIVGRLTTDSESMAIEKSLAKNTGVTLNV